MNNLEQIKNKANNINLDVSNATSRDDHEWAIEGKPKPKYSVTHRKPRYTIESFVNLEDIDVWLDKRIELYQEMKNKSNSLTSKS